MRFTPTLSVAVAATCVTPDTVAPADGGLAIDVECVEGEIIEAALPGETRRPPQAYPATTCDAGIRQIQRPGLGGLPLPEGVEVLPGVGAAHLGPQVTAVGEQGHGGPLVREPPG